MRYGRVVLFSLLLSLAVPLAGRAGIYIPADFARWDSNEVPPWMPTGDDFIRFVEKRGWLRNIGVKRTEAQKKELETNASLKKILEIYQREVTTLEARQAAGTLTLEDRINLSGYYLRLAGPGNENRVEKAIAVLTTDGRTPFDSGNAFLLSNLATAISLRQQVEPQHLQEAMDHLDTAIQIWPAASLECPNPFLSNWFLHAEKAQYQLLRLRYKEAVREAVLDQQEKIHRAQERNVDDLFPVLPRMWSTDGYSAGCMKPADSLELPSNATDLVVQLIYWYPYDDRLYWLLGELQNAVHGRFKDTLAILDQLTKSNYHLNLIAEHRHVLMQAKQWIEALTGEPRRIAGEQLMYSLGIPTGDPKDPGLLLLSPLPLPMGPQATMNALALVVAVNRADLVQGDRTVSIPSGDSAPPPATATKWNVDWKPILASFVAGAVLALLGSQQWREFQRRRQVHRPIAIGHVSEPSPKLHDAPR